jgi:hypothetical protein
MASVVPGLSSLCPWLQAETPLHLSPAWNLAQEWDILGPKKGLSTSLTLDEDLDTEPIRGNPTLQHLPCFMC